MTETALSRARAGDEEAFRQLVDPFRRELQLHCYRILGSLQDAEDQLQETLLAAWRGLEGFGASLRGWLYRIATNRCLNALRASKRRPQEVSSMVEPPEPTRKVEPVWLEPYPDVLLEGPPHDRETRRGAHLRPVPTRANGQPAFGCYVPDAQSPIARAYGLMVLTLSGEAISAITWFSERSLLAYFGLPRTLPE